MIIIIGLDLLNLIYCFRLLIQLNFLILGFILEFNLDFNLRLLLMILRKLGL